MQAGVYSVFVCFSTLPSSKPWHFTTEKAEMFIFVLTAGSRRVSNTNLNVEAVLQLRFFSNTNPYVQCVWEFSKVPLGPPHFPVAWFGKPSRIKCLHLSTLLNFLLGFSFLRAILWGGEQAKWLKFIQLPK